MRGTIYSKNNNSDKSKWFYGQMIKDDPMDEIAYLNLLLIHLNNDEFKCATMMLDNISDTFSIDKPELEILVANYTDFTASDAYRTWHNR